MEVTRELPSAVAGLDIQTVMKEPGRRSRRRCRSSRCRHKHRQPWMVSVRSSARETVEGAAVRTAAAVMHVHMDTCTQHTHTHVHSAHTLLLKQPAAQMTKHEVR